MPLSILVPMILVGLPLVIGLVYWFGESKNSALSEETAGERFKLDFPRDHWDAVVLDDRGETAILENKGKPIGFVTSVGQNQITRRFDGKVLRSVHHTDDGVDLFLNDFTLKRISLAFANSDSRADMLKKLTKTEKTDGPNNS